LQKSINFLTLILYNYLAPTSVTVSDFWRMIDEKDIKAVVMLANFYQINQKGELKVGLNFLRIKN
jgi:hypothetical protein